MAAVDKVIIGLSGKKRSGKDTVAEFLKQLFPGAVLVSFADRLKKVASMAIGKNPYYFEGNDDRKDMTYQVGFNTMMTGRELLQKIGTEGFRNNICDDFWVWSLINEIEEAPPGLYIITDVRFPNEYMAIIEHDGLVVRVNRDLGETDEHASEASLDDFDFDRVFDNNGTIDQLKEQVAAWVATLQTKKILPK